MSFSFSSSPLMESFPSTRFSSPVPSPTRTETDLPIEVDQSFNSSMSISESPALSPTPFHSKPLPISPTESAPISVDTFLSPTPAFGSRPRRPDPVPIQSHTDELKGLGFPDLGAKRTFGRELSLNTSSTVRASGLQTFKAGKGMMLPPAVPDKAPKRGGIPMQWTSSNEELGDKLFQPSLLRHQTEPSSSSPRSQGSGASSTLGMDIDSPAIRGRKSPMGQSPSFSGAASFSGSPGLGSFFCESPIAPALPPAKRRSLVSGSPASPSGSPSAKRSSLGMSRNLEKTASSSAMLFGAGRASTLAARRGQPYKRPSILPVPLADGPSGSGSTNSAYPILYGAKPTLGGVPSGMFPRAATAPMRRAFSVCDQTAMPEMSEDESEYEASPSVAATAHAEYARRTGSRFVPRVDGSPGFKPCRQSMPVAGDGVGGSPCGKGKKASPFGRGGMPGFGDNEMDGKILPCHKVKEDGLVRITSSTLDGLIGGKYADKVRRYHIIDCRFDYEFAGGHIAGATNVKSMDALDNLLLTEDSGLHSGDHSLPTPSRSGDSSEGEQVVLIFHCEFSAKRAPTFAKHLRSRDRTLNGAFYPRIFYPELYILEGGYCGFYQSQPDRCEPRGYTPMDDPRHFERRNSDLHDFRKFSRTRSFTYGEIQAPSASSRSTLPPCPPLAFAAASAAVGRRQGPTIAEEDHEHDSSPLGATGGAGDSDRIDASPCPRVVSMGHPPIFGSSKPRAFGRVGFARVASYAGTGQRP